MAQQRDVRSRIVLGVTGGIAAYKTAELVRLLTARGYDVVPVMTPWAARFIGPLTLETLSGHEVRVETPTSDASTGVEHISLIRSADLLLIAPLTANTLAKMVHGLADNFLTNTYLAHQGKTLICPAMNTAMLSHPATQRNLEQIAQDGAFALYGSSGSLACGETGAGRMAEPEAIVDYVEELLTPQVPALVGKRVLVSAGPTAEDLDPVRFITNRSSGKMGFALARAFRNAGARVTLVHGPVNLDPIDRVSCVPVRSAAEMEEAVLSRRGQSTVVVMAAAVADYRPDAAPQKLKKDQFNGQIQLHRTTDILAELGKSKPAVLAGFAAESETLLENAGDKLRRKNLDWIFANDISKAEQGFGSDQNRIHAINRDGEITDLGAGSKQDLARQIVELCARGLSA